MNRPSLQQLYAIESEFEPVFLEAIAAAVRDDKKLAGTHRAYLEFSDQDKLTPFIELRLTDLKPDPESAPYRWPDGREDYLRWHGILVVHYITSRGLNSDDQAEIVGWLRARTLSILGCGAPSGGIDESQPADFKMPYHFVAQIMPGVTPRSIEPDLGLDVSELQFPIVIEAKPELFG
jgi:hypothetical protein